MTWGAVDGIRGGSQVSTVMSKPGFWLLVGEGQGGGHGRGREAQSLGAVPPAWGFLLALVVGHVGHVWVWMKLLPRSLVCGAREYTPWVHNMALESFKE